MKTPFIVTTSTGAIIHDGSPLQHGQTIELSEQDAARLVGLITPAVEVPAQEAETIAAEPEQPVIEEAATSDTPKSKKKSKQADTEDQTTTEDDSGW